MYTGELNHNRPTRYRRGLKENTVHVIVNHNPSEASPADELVVKMPQLTKDSVLYPNSLKLTYKYKLDTNATEADIPDHLSSAIIQKSKFTINGQTIWDTDNYNHLKVYKEMHKPKHEYDKELTHLGIQKAETKRKRHNISGAAEDTLASIHGERYAYNLECFFTDTSFTPQAIHNSIEFHLKLAPGKYTLKNICLEYDYVIEPSLAREIVQKYTNYTHFIDDYKCHTVKNLKDEESNFEININASYESLRAILTLFKADNTVSTMYPYPMITDKKVDVDGSANQLYPTGYLPQYSYQDAKNYFQTDPQSESHVNQESFYGDKYSLVTDFRTINDEKSSGIGRQIKDYVKLKLSKGETEDVGKAFVYPVTEKAVSFLNNQLSGVEQ